MELHGSVNAQKKAHEIGITQSSKGRKRKRKTVNIEETWGKRTEKKKNRSVYFNAIDKFASRRARIKTEGAQPDNIIKQYSESEETIATSSSNKSASSSTSINDNIVSSESSSIGHCDSTSSASKRSSTVSSEYSISSSIDLGNSTADADKKSENSVEFDLKNNNSASPINENSSANQESIIIDEQSSKEQHTSNPEAIVGGERLRWPKFGIKNAIFQGRSYSFTLTCSIDSALFSLYYIYKSDINVANDFDTAPESSPYSILVKTFNLADERGWDIARIYWMQAFTILKPPSKHPTSLFGSVDEIVFNFVKSQQRHSSKTVCSRHNCTWIKREWSSTELDIFCSDDHIEKFENKIYGRCQAMLKGYDEISYEEAVKERYKESKILITDCESNNDQYVYGWVCNSVNITTVADFDDSHPPIIIVNVRPLSRRSEEGYQINIARLRDIKSTIRIGSVRYKLRAAINHMKEHFTATLIDRRDSLYIFDDLQGVRDARTSTDPVEIAIYTKIYTF